MFGFSLLNHEKGTCRKMGAFSCLFYERTVRTIAGLTEKQKRFADEYLIDLNATQAYKVAYPSVKNEATAAAAAVRLLRNVKVKTYIDERLAEIKSEKTADATEVLETLTAIMRGEISEEVPLLCGDGCQTLSDKGTAVKDRLKAAELLGKRYALFEPQNDPAGNAIADFLKAIRPTPEDIKAMYADEEDDEEDS